MDFMHVAPFDFKIFFFYGLHGLGGLHRLHGLHAYDALVHRLAPVTFSMSSCLLALDHSFGLFNLLFHGLGELHDLPP
jgi:hypothetical protein